MPQEFRASEVSEPQTFAPLSEPLTTKPTFGAGASAPAANLLQAEDTLEAQKVIRRLRRNSPVRASVNQALNQMPLTTLRPLLIALDRPFGWQWGEAKAAAWALGAAPLSPSQKTEAVAALTQLLHRPASRADAKCFRAARWLAFLTAVYCTATLLWPSPNHAPAHPSDAFYWALVALFCFTLAGCIFWSVLLLPFGLFVNVIYRERRKQMRMVAAEALGRLADTGSVSILADVLQDPTLFVREAALHAVVPLLIPQHRSQLPPGVIPSLCRDLSDFHPEPRVLERLDALEMVGDGRAIYALSQLATRGQRPHIRERAMQVLEVLTERQAQENAPKFLLRASEASNVAPDVLLRAASGDNRTEPEQLLRATNDAS